MFHWAFIYDSVSSAIGKCCSHIELEESTEGGETQRGEGAERARENEREKYLSFHGEAGITQ